MNSPTRSAAVEALFNTWEVDSSRAAEAVLEALPDYHIINEFLAALLARRVSLTREDLEEMAMNCCGTLSDEDFVLQLRNLTDLVASSHHVPEMHHSPPTTPREKEGSLSAPFRQATEIEEDIVEESPEGTLLPPSYVEDNFSVDDISPRDTVQDTQKAEEKAKTPRRKVPPARVKPSPLRSSPEDDLIQDTRLTWHTDPDPPSWCRWDPLTGLESGGTKFQNYLGAGETPREQECCMWSIYGALHAGLILREGFDAGLTPEDNMDLSDDARNRAWVVQDDIGVVFLYHRGRGTLYVQRLSTTSNFPLEPAFNDIPEDATCFVYAMTSLSTASQSPLRLVHHYVSNTGLLFRLQAQNKQLFDVIQESRKQAGLQAGVFHWRKFGSEASIASEASKTLPSNTSMMRKQLLTYQKENEKLRHGSQREKKFREGGREELLKTLREREAELAEAQTQNKTLKSLQYRNEKALFTSPDNAFFSNTKAVDELRSFDARRQEELDWYGTQMAQLQSEIDKAQKLGEAKVKLIERLSLVAQQSTQDQKERREIDQLRHRLQEMEAETENLRKSLSVLGKIQQSTVQRREGLHRDHVDLIAKLRHEIESTQSHIDKRVVIIAENAVFHAQESQRHSSPKQKLSGTDSGKLTAPVSKAPPQPKVSHSTVPSVKEQAPKKLQPRPPAPVMLDLTPIVKRKPSKSKSKKKVMDTDQPPPIHPTAPPHPPLPVGVDTDTALGTFITSSLVDTQPAAPRTDDVSAEPVMTNMSKIQLILSRIAGAQQKLSEIEAQESSKKDIDMCRHCYAAMKGVLCDILNGAPSRLHIEDPATAERLVELVRRVLLKEKDEDGNNEWIVRSILGKCDVDCSSVLNHPNTLLSVCERGNIRYLRAIYALYPDLECDDIKVVPVACANSAVRIPLMKVLLEHKVILHTHELRDVLIVFLRSITDVEKLSPKEATEGREDLIEILHALPGIKEAAAAKQKDIENVVTVQGPGP